MSSHAFDDKFDSVEIRFIDELKKIRTGRANASILDGVKAEVYGQLTPIIHLATVSVLDAQTLQVSPFDPSNLSVISAAVRNSQSLGLNPADDGRVIRIPIPPMTTERRQTVVKQVREKVEEANIAMRNIRHDLIKHAKQQEKSKDMSEDELKKFEKSVDEKLNQIKSNISQLAQEKEAEIMKV